ncbi:ATPase [Lysinibacillus sp. FJAT-14745]|uniref:ATP-binding protein n=1 Tax=Lysinibacillus sp. FJAT-14745 TaxID=1704289 RepID=UPI0006ABB148|nr:ATP-binding protein [Lysinibacillus sp. FJAT-14745]KOP80952.1 ATPase [Lysinibacillus sp. FJAT-14745]
MKKYYEYKQLFILIHQLFIITFLCNEFLQKNIVGTTKFLPLVLITIMVIYGAYISFINFKDNKTLSQFSNLLFLTAWQFLLTLNGNPLFYTLSIVLGIVILYLTVQFLLLFFFQDSIYIYKKETDSILKIICLSTLVSKLINDTLFAFLFSFQLIVSFSCVIFIFLKNRKRISFVLKNEKKHLLQSATILIVPFIGYAVLFAKSPEHLSNLGWYTVIFLPLFSIHAIAFKNYKFLRKYFLLKEYKMGLLLLCCLVFMSLLGVLFNFNMITYFIILHTIFWFVLLYFILLFHDTKTTMLHFGSVQPTTLPEGSYVQHLVQIAKEEKLKNSFSNYLHDEILQDILAVKNMMNKSTKQEVREIIVNTLDNLNLSIREQMQEYHPTILKTLTLKENYSHLIAMIQQKYGNKHIKMKFCCNDHFFLVEPYHLIIYRILKELVTNAFKHSKCTNLFVKLALENDEIKLIVKDNGVGLLKENTDANNHSGWASIKEQLFLLNGSMSISKCTPSGLCITILIPMKGDESYQYFINR